MSRPRRALVDDRTASTSCVMRADFDVASILTPEDHGKENTRSFDMMRTRTRRRMAHTQGKKQNETTM